MSEKELKRKVISLEEENQRLRTTIKDVSRNLLRVIRTLGLETDDLKDQKKAKKKAVKSISGLVFQMAADAESVEKRFHFLGEFKSIFEENEELVNEILQEKEFQK